MARPFSRRALGAASVAVLALLGFVGCASEPAGPDVPTASAPDGSTGDAQPEPEPAQTDEADGPANPVCAALAASGILEAVGLPSELKDVSEPGTTATCLVHDDETWVRAEVWGPDADPEHLADFPLSPTERAEAQMAQRDEPPLAWSGPDDTQTWVDSALPAGRHTVLVQTARDGGAVSLHVDASLDITVEQVVAAATRLADAIDMQEAFAHAASYVRPDDW